jgi:formylglycine-generating enzyme required for sulfatase activity
MAERDDAPGAAGCCGGLARGADPAMRPASAGAGPVTAGAQSLGIDPDAGRRADAVWFPPGASHVGTDRPAIKADGEGPRRRVQLKGFALERFAVTNRRFAAFVAATGFVTEAERFGWSYVFHSLLDPAFDAPVPEGLPWWRGVDGASWRMPEGPGSGIETRLDHPVVHVSWNDAAAFAAWCGGRLPSEAEWEHAARGGIADRRFPWGEEEPSDSRILCNIWQGRFPDLDTGADGYRGTAPVDAFAPNPLGFHNMSGNVWEWCEDPFRVRSLGRAGKERDRMAVAERERTLKGGSYLCHISYCYRYRIAARMGRAPDTSTGHTGFRVAYDRPM